MAAVQIAGTWYALYEDHQGRERSTRLPRAQSQAEAENESRKIARSEARARRILLAQIGQTPEGVRG